VECNPVERQLFLKGVLLVDEVFQRLKHFPGGGAWSQKKPNGRQGSVPQVQGMSTLRAG
jgi:hypothetical protein